VALKVRTLPSRALAAPAAGAAVLLCHTSKLDMVSGRGRTGEGGGGRGRGTGGGGRGRGTGGGGRGRGTGGGGRGRGGRGDGGRGGDGAGGRGGEWRGGGGPGDGGGGEGLGEERSTAEQCGTGTQGAHSDQRRQQMSLCDSLNFRASANTTSTQDKQCTQQRQCHKCSALRGRCRAHRCQTRQGCWTQWRPAQRWLHSGSEGREAQGRPLLPRHIPEKSEQTGAGMFSCRQAGRQAGRQASGRAGLQQRVAGQALRSLTVPEQAVVGYTVNCGVSAWAEVHVPPAPHILDAGCTTRCGGEEGAAELVKQASIGANSCKQPSARNCRCHFMLVLTHSVCTVCMRCLPGAGKKSRNLCSAATARQAT
jgi:hypothetical protein